MVLELARGRSQYYSHPACWCGCGTWLVVGGGEGRDTLLSPEASAVRQVSLEGRWSLLPPSWVLACDALVARVGGLVSCELDSGREHLAASL